MIHRLRQQWFLACLLLVVPLGLLWPELGRELRASGAMPWLVALTLFASGLNLDTRALDRGLLSPWPLGLVLGTTYVAAPLLALLFCRWLGPETESRAFLEAVLIAAAQAGTLSSAIALTAMARGREELALLFTLVSNAATVVLTPLILELTLGRTVELDMAGMMSRMALFVLLPVVCGQVVRGLAQARVAKLRPISRLVPQLIILSFVLAGFGAASEHLLGDVALVMRFFAVAAALHLALLALTTLGSRLLGLDRGARAAVVFCGSQKTLPNGIYLWERFFSHNPYGALAIVTYHLFQLILDTFLVPWLRVRPEEEATDSGA